MKKRIALLVIIIYIITMLMAEVNFIDSGKAYARDPDAPMGHGNATPPEQLTEEQILLQFATWAYNFSQTPEYAYNSGFFTYYNNDEITRRINIHEIFTKYNRANNYLPPADSGTYYLDCVAWVAAAHTMFFGIDFSQLYPFPYAPDYKVLTPFFKDVSSEPLLPGDIIMTPEDKSPDGSGHVAIWIGQIEGRDGYWIVEQGVQLTQLETRADGFYDRKNRKYNYHARIDINNIDPTQLAPVGGGGLIGGSIGFSNVIIDDFNVDLDNLEFDFSGNPTTVSITGKTNSEKGVFDFIKQFLNYILGIMFSVIKVSILGWTNIIENIINDVLIATGGSG